MNQARIGLSLRLALALSAGLALSACDRQDPAGDALNRAHIKLTSLSPFGATLPATDTKLKTYNDVIATLKSVSSTGTPTQVASASLLTAQAQMGLAEPAAAQAGEIDRQVFTMLTSVRSALAQHQALSSRAEAAAAFDPSKELAAIDAADAERVEQIKQAEAARGVIEKKVADLQAKSRAKSDEARAKRQQAGALKQKVVTQTATQGEQTLLESRRIAREADARDVEAANLEAEAAKVAPEAVEVQNTIDRLTKQRELLARERGDVGRRTQAAKEQAASLKAEAAKAADEIKKLAGQIHELRAGELAEQTKKAVDGFTLAASTASKAVPELKGTAQLIVGSARQSLGDVHLGTVRSLQVYGHVLESLGTAKYPLADGAAYKSRLEETKTEAKESLDAAFEAYQAADAAYGAVGGSGEAKNRLDRLNAGFRALVKAAGGSDDLIPSRGEPETPAPAAAPETPAAATAEGTPQATLQALIDIEKNGNYEASEQYFLASTDAEKQALKAFISLQPKVKLLDDACKAKLGTSLEEMTKQMGSASGNFSFTGVKSAADIPVQVEGETATFTLPDGKPRTMKQRDGKWLVEMSAFGMPAEMLAMAAPMMGTLGKVFEDLAADVNSGKITTLDALTQAMTQKMMGMKPGG